MYDPNHKKQESINMIVIKHKTKSNALQNNIITDVSNDKHNSAFKWISFSGFHSFDCILILRINLFFTYADQTNTENNYSNQIITKIEIKRIIVENILNFCQI